MSEGDDVVEHPVAIEGGDGELTVADLVERERYTVVTDAAVSPTAVDPDDVLFPVDAAARVTARALTFPNSPSLYIRDVDGEMLADTIPPAECEFGAGEYYLEVDTPMKLYLRVTGPLTVTATVEERRVELDAPGRVVVGGRSRHDRPAATVTTTAEPADLMRAVSTFGSALKTTSPERTFPTLRGHPPLVELGDGLSVPDEVAPPRTGVTVEVPPEYRYVYPVAPLAYFLGARVVPGDTPRLVTDDGLAHDLAPGGEFERAVERVLKGTFLLDCVTRTEGLYEVPLHERRALEPELELDFASLYDRPLPERLAAYLAVDYETLAPAMPDWKLTTYVETTPAAAETLPFVVDDMAVVRTDESSVHRDAAPRASPPDEQADAVESLLRSTESTGPVETGVAIDDAGSMELSWVGDGAPRGASKATATAYRNRLDRSPTDGDIGVTVVCNEPELLADPGDVEDVYDGSAVVDRQEELTTEELRGVLVDDADFLHYIGHIEPDGIRCTDGLLDVRAMGEVGVESFLLNACTSYDQGMALIDAGAVGGVVTLADVVNASAVRMGATLARLLNNGYPLRPSLDIARHASYSSDDYVVVGDGTLQLATTDGKMIDLYRLRPGDDVPVLEFISYSHSSGGMGTIYQPHIEDNEQYYLPTGTIDEFEFDDVDSLLEYLRLKEVPVVIGDTLHWSTAVTAADVPSGL